MTFWLSRITHFKYFIGLITATIISTISAGLLVIEFGHLADGMRTHLTPYTHWISLMPSNFKLALFFSIPILCALSCAQILHEDFASGYAFQTMKRIGVMSYTLKMQFLAVITGALTIGMPLLINFGILWTFFPSLIPNLMLNRNMPLLGSETYCHELYYSQPLTLMLFYTVLAMFVGGFYSLLSLAISCYTDNKFIPFVAGFSTTLLLNMLSSVTSHISSPVLIAMELSTGQIISLRLLFYGLLFSYVVASIATSLGVQQRVIK